MSRWRTNGTKICKQCKYKGPMEEFSRFNPHLCWACCDQPFTGTPSTNPVHLPGWMWEK